MSFEMFDVQAALLYAAPRRLDASVLQKRLRAQSADAPTLLPTLELMPSSSEDFFLLTGGHVHVTIRFQDASCDHAAFDNALQSPLRHLRAFDYAAAVDEHRAAIIVNVGDGETLMSSDARQQMAAMTGASGVDPLLKLATLHMVMQAITALARPIVVDFCPTMTLVRPEEYVDLADRTLPFRILFHPYPEIMRDLPGGEERMTITAYRSEQLIGATLVLEWVPVNLDIAAIQEICAALIERKFAGRLALEDGDEVTLTADVTLYIRHAEGQVIASLRRPAVEAVQSEGQQDFQKRLAKLDAKKPAQPPRRDIARREPVPIGLPKVPMRLIFVAGLLVVSLSATAMLFPQNMRQYFFQSIQDDLAEDANIELLNRQEVDIFEGSSLSAKPADGAPKTLWQRLNDASGDL